MRKPTMLLKLVLCIGALAGADFARSATYSVDGQLASSTFPTQFGFSPGSQFRLLITISSPPTPFPRGGVSCSLAAYVGQQDVFFAANAQLTTDNDGEASSVEIHTEDADHLAMPGSALAGAVFAEISSSWRPPPGGVDFSTGTLSEGQLSGVRITLSAVFQDQSYYEANVLEATLALIPEPCGSVLLATATSLIFFRRRRHSAIS
jgi:hypothetical protein